MLPVDRDPLQRWRPPDFDIPHWRLAEEPAVFPAELAWAFIADLKGRAGSIQTVHEHAHSRRV
jgi:hypothetical protein